MSVIEEFDLVIIGAGPAGLSTALHLVQEDPSWMDRLVLLEKDVHPRPKLCGGGLTRIGLETLRELDFPLPLPIEQSRVDNVYLKYKNHTIHVQGKPMFTVFDRPEFDNYLVLQSKDRGIQIKEKEPALSLVTQQDNVLVETKKGVYRTKMIVCADGSTGTISRTIVGNQVPSRISRTLEVWAQANQDSLRFSQRSALFNFDFLTDHLQGYYWEFPTKKNGVNYHNRGVYDSRINRKKDRPALPAILEKATCSSSEGGVYSPLSGAPIHWFSPRNKMSTNRVMFVGDAAGVDGLFGEGIGPSLVYGKIAAMEIRHAIKERDFSFRTYKKRLLKSQLGRYLLIRWLGAKYLYYLGNWAFFPNILWRAGIIIANNWQGRPLY